MKGAEDNKMENAKQLFLEAYDHNSESILRHIYFRVNNMSLAEDLVSETFLKTWQYIRQGSEIKNLRAFLYQVANNLIIDHYRAKYKSTVSIEDIAEPADPKEGRADENIDQQITFGLVKEHLASLPPDYQKILIYRYIDDLSISEIKKLTEKSTANIYVIIHRALKILRKKMSSAGGPPSEPPVRTEKHKYGKEN